MSDRRHCACGDWEISAYGRWCPSCMGELQHIKLGDRILINDEVEPFEVVALQTEPTSYDDTEEEVVSISVISTAWNAPPSDRRVQLLPSKYFKISVKSGEFRSLRLGRKTLIWTFQVCPREVSVSPVPDTQPTPAAPLDGKYIDVDGHRYRLVSDN